MRAWTMMTAVVVFCTGCQSFQVVQQQAAQKEGVTCSAIHQAYNAYQADRDSARAMTQLATLVSPEVGGTAGEAITDTGHTFEQIRASTTIALAVKGCQPL